jgi:hypothetical protein
MPSAELKLAYSSPLERLECADLLRLSSSRCRVSFFKIGKLHAAMRASGWSGHVSSVHHTAPKLVCPRLYGCNLRSQDLSVSLFIPRVLSVVEIDMSLSRLSASSLRRLLAGKTPARLRLDEMITTFCGLLRKTIPDAISRDWIPGQGLFFFFSS